MILMKRCGWIAALALFLVLPLIGSGSVSARHSHSDHEVEEALKHIFDARAASLITRNTGSLKIYYLEQPASRYALKHEWDRSRYVNSWADQRALKLVHADSGIRITRMNRIGDIAKVSLVQSLKVGYVYLNNIVPEQSFGVGTRHSLTLEKKDGEWRIAREWYLDPLEEDPNAIAEGPEGVAPSVKPAPADRELPKEPGKYNRARAVKYANKYAGAAWGAGNQHRYNKRYLDYTGKGGDCTNFASQSIGDPEEGGGLPMAGGWRYFYGSGGTRLWVHTDSFGRFLVRSGYGTVIAKGTYKEIVTPSSKYPDGAISRLQPGDLIGHIVSRDDIDHFSVVAGFDAHGYPVVNSHTADRYRVPFDLGWDRDTKYVLFHIRD